MSNDTDWTNKYFNEEAQGKVDEQKNLWSPELQERVTREWNELFRDVEAALGEDPASPTAQSLVARWKKLVGEFTRGNPEIQKGLNKMYSDAPNWPAQQKHQIKPEIKAFIMKAMKATPTT
jgi:MerR family transcriptional regulator, thiopeptide resistance regulator